MKVRTHHDEQALLQDLQNGDHKAFEEIYQMYQPSLVFFAKRILFSHNLPEAEEIVQDSLLKFYAKRNHFSSLVQIRSFIYVTTKNACLQRIEKEKVRIRRFERFASNVDEEEDIIIQEIIYAETVRELRQEIEKLPTKCREIMEKLISEGKSPSEVAEDLNISVSTINNQKARAIAILKKKLKGAGLLLLLSQL